MADDIKTLNEAARQNGIKQGGISNACRGLSDSYMGFRWSYK